MVKTLLKFRKLSNLLNLSGNMRAVTRPEAVSPTRFLCERCPLPKFLPSGKGLALALSGSKSGVSPLRNLSQNITIYEKISNLFHLVLSFL